MFKLSFARVIISFESSKKKSYKYIHSSEVVVFKSFQTLVAWKILGQSKEMATQEEASPTVSSPKITVPARADAFSCSCVTRQDIHNPSKQFENLSIHKST